jgi:hypothetical protein
LRITLWRRILTLAPAVAWFAGLSWAQETAELLNRMKAMEDRIKALEAEVQTLKGQQARAVPTPPPGAQIPPGPPPPGAVPMQPPPESMAAPQLGGAGAAAAKALNPDISVIGDFLGAVGNPANRPTPSLEMHESEVGFQEAIDPYARADFFLSFGEHGVDLEEGFLTFTSLPAGLQVRVGKMRAAFGKVNSLHNHVLPWTDRPLVTQDLVGGEDGINDAGLSLSRLIPAPKGIFLEGIAQLYRGDSDDVFQSRKRSDVSTVEHLHAYRDLSESTNIDIGGSFARGKSPFADGWNQLYGIDAMLRWKPLRRAIYHSFVARSEFIWARTAINNPLLYPPPAPVLPPVSKIIVPFGYYASADYQLGRRWFLGGRFDRSQRGACQPTNPPTVSLTEPPVVTPCNLPYTSLVQDTGGSLVLTYWPSEFSQIRGQLRRTRYGDAFTTNEFLFQFQFSMGAHGAHPF